MRIPNPDIDPARALADWQAEQDRPPAEGAASYRCRLVTPMFGGGVEAGVVDREMPVRGSAVRGQLRFWWRIANGPFPSPALMFERERKVWGGIGKKRPTASQVTLRVACKPVEDRQLVGSGSYDDPGIRYAFGPAAIDGGADWLRPDYSFDLHVHCPDEVRTEVETALRWWASFGGIGARTRRGFGALQVRGLAPVGADEVAAKGGLLRFCGTGGGVAEPQWKTAVGQLFRFRQGPGVGRRPGSSRPGRSYWPEADQLRRFTGRDANGRHEAVHPAGNVFPRAAFGLPIGFEFRASPGDPPKTELLPAGETDRMASPLLLRPYWDGRRWRAAALLLQGWEAAANQPLRLKDCSNSPPGHWPADGARRRAVARTIAPMCGEGGQPLAHDPLPAFMHFFENSSR